MTGRDFCFWLQGSFEMHPEDEGLSPKQVEILKAHLALVFTHEIDPSMGSPEHQEVLNTVHNTPPGKIPSGITPSVHVPPRQDTLYRC